MAARMALLFLLYGLIILALVGIAIYEHITISTLSLPVSPALTILTILLPLLSPLTTLLAPNLFKPPRNKNNNNNNNTRNRHTLTIPHNPPTKTTLTPPTLTTLTTLAHLLQLLLTTTLTTLHTTHLTSPTTTSCLLSQRWRTLFQAHDARAVRAIQDALACCGFRSARDMAWPFPPAGRDACQTQFGRTEACLPAWEGVWRGAVGAELGVCLCVGVVQVVGVYLARRGGFSFSFGRLIGGSGGGGGGDREGGVEAGSRRPLLAGPERDGEGNGGGRVVETGYQDDVDEEEVGERERDEEEEAGPRREGTGYGAAREGPRVEPAHHDPWAGVQRG
ncbi:hypothetical protein F5144DRAFT_622843 [Chaetomium tenue]|uniref:Uncharacterized protein n=1 Tax=Chaetomium tenue TaxID=1854479 RepID=A0ACB7NWA0_9PEZI|nr:hypothetical protein F5144DRAFT_622843 [Chaetomium globosum]